MPHPDFNQPVAYVAMEGPRDFEIVLNARDDAAPTWIYTVDGRYAQRVTWLAPVGRPPIIPADWKPVPGVTRRIVAATEGWAWDHAHEMAAWMREHDRQDNLEAILFQGLMREVDRQGPALELIPTQKEDPMGKNDDKDRDRSAVTGQFVSDKYADEHPDTTVSERVKPAEKRGPESGPVSEGEDA